MLERLKTVARRFPLVERCARRIFDHRYQLARKYLNGIGIEIGALDRPLALPSQAKVYYVDHLFPEQLKGHYPELSHRKFCVSIVGDGEHLSFVLDDSLDFLVANHLIEHCEDPIAAFETFAKKLHLGGIVFMAVPDMRRTFDRKREETTWEHLLEDHKQGPQISRAQHYQEWSSRVKDFSGEAAERYAEELSTMKYSIHFHCWTRQGFTEFIKKMNLCVPLSILEVQSWHNENLFILRKVKLADS